MSRILKTNEELEYFKQIVKGNTTEEIINLFEKKYGRKLTKQQVKRQKRTHNLKSGIDSKFQKGCMIGKEYQFQKGHMPTNAFPKGYNPRNKFPKGHIPHNKKYGYYEFIGNDGYIYVKVGESKFIQKQRYIWEQHHGKIPKGYYVMFLDQDKTNYDIDNLILVEKGAYMGAIGTRLITNEPELNKTLIYTEQLKEKIKEIKKDGKVSKAKI